MSDLATKPQTTFEDNIDIINKIIFSKRDFWQLKSLSYMDFSDVAQIVRCHIHNKWEQYIQSEPLERWVARVTTNRIKNLIRDNYGRVAPPCNKCPFNNGGTACGLTESGLKTGECKRYRKWEKGRKSAYELKLASPLEDYDNTTLGIVEFDVSRSAEKFHCKILPLLNDKMKLAYQYLFIDNLTDEEAALKLGFKSSENRSPGYKQLMNIKNKIFKLAQDVIEDFDVVY